MRLSRYLPSYLVYFGKIGIKGERLQYNLEGLAAIIGKIIREVNERFGKRSQ